MFRTEYHVPLLTRVVPGEITVRLDGHEEFLAVGEGLVEITADHVWIVTDMAIAAKDIDEAKVEEARERAAARLRDKISDEEVATVNASLARSLACDAPLPRSVAKWEEFIALPPLPNTKICRSSRSALRKTSTNCAVPSTGIESSAAFCAFR